MGVELCRGDVGVTEHLLHRAQVAPAGQQVRGERVAQGVRAHLALEPRRARVALDDLVQALPGQPAATLVDEQLRLGADADEIRTAGLQVAPRRRRGLPAERHYPLL